MSIAKVGGPFGAHTTITLDARDTLECEVHGISDERAARLMHGDTQVAVSQKPSDFGFMLLSVPASFLGDSVESTELRVELGRERVAAHARSTAESALDWSAVGSITVHSSRAFSLGFLSASAPMLLATVVLGELSNGPAQASRARFAVDLLTLVVSVGPLLFAARAKVRGTPKVQQTHALSAIASALVIASTVSNVQVENRTGHEVAVRGERLAIGRSRWLPFEVGAQTSALGAELEVLRSDERRVCVAPPSARDLSTRLFSQLRVAPRAMRTISRTALRQYGLSDSALCDRLLSEGDECCVRPERVASPQPMSAEMSGGAQASWTLRSASTAPTLDLAAIGPRNLQIYGWNGIYLSEAIRALPAIEGRWRAPSPAAQLLVRGFAVDRPRELRVVLADHRALDVQCPSTTEAVHVLRAQHAAQLALTFNGERVALATSGASVLCAGSMAHDLAVTVDHGVDRPSAEPLWTTMERWSLPVHSLVVEVRERRGAQELTLGHARCPVERARQFKLVPVKMEGFARPTMILQLNSDFGTTERWSPTSNMPAHWAWLCVEADENDRPRDTPAARVTEPASLSVRYSVHDMGPRVARAGALRVGAPWTMRAIESSPNARPAPKGPTCHLGRDEGAGRL